MPSLVNPLLLGAAGKIPDYLAQTLITASGQLIIQWMGWPAKATSPTPTPQHIHTGQYGVESHQGLDDPSGIPIRYRLSCNNSQTIARSASVAGKIHFNKQSV